MLAFKVVLDSVISAREFWKCIEKFLQAVFTVDVNLTGKSNANSNQTEIDP